MRILLSKEFKTKLGIIRTWIQSDIDDSVIAQDDYYITTANYQINLQSFELRNDWISVTMSFDSSIGWRWFVEKTSDSIENLILFCTLIKPKPNLELDYCSGECLDAVEISNQTHILHIGTEDGEIMRSRSMNNDCMPLRFENLLDYDQTFTKYLDFGFKTIIPALYNQEKIYFHYLIATKTIKQSLEYSKAKDIDISTWFAVDQSKTFLDQYLGVESEQS